jgi:ubiquitin carboxyl-terminal hydrolase 9/24
LLRGGAADDRSDIAHAFLDIAKLSVATSGKLFSLLAAAAASIAIGNDNVTEYFWLLRELVTAGAAKAASAGSFAGLAECVESRLRAFPPPPPHSAGDARPVLVGLLSLLDALVGADAELASRLTSSDFMVWLWRNGLHAMPDRDCIDRRPLAGDTAARSAAFQLLSTLAQQSGETVSSLVDVLVEFVGDKPLGDNVPRSRWGFDPSRERKPAGIRYVGLRNQGCTCYLNATMQNLFMNPAFREVILTSPVPPPPPTPDTTALALCKGADLVGLRVRMKWVSGKAYTAEVKKFDEAKGMHTIRYENDDESCNIVLCTGRSGRETGKYTVLPGPPSEADATSYMLRELQRTFRYLGFTESAAYDPKAFVESCRCLRMNFSVYQQNDASEFYDQILDKSEEALKKITGGSAYEGVLGGKFVYQKIPTDCMHRSNRHEAFARVELTVRGKSSLEECLATFAEGEMMDGDNKVECEECGTKKDTLRRQCFSGKHLPNLLPLHLKRFDLGAFCRVQSTRRMV